MLEKFERYFKKLGYDKPTLIQSKVYPLIEQNKSVLGLSPTGSGKTVAFLMPSLLNLNLGEGSQLMIIEPSQELAIQTARVARNWANLLGLKVLALTGGANIKRQIERLKKHPEVIVGTAGRLKNLIDDKKLKTHLFKTVIIDEADDLLQGETLTTVREIVDNMMSDVQLEFFSATETEILEELDHWFGNRNIQKVDVRNEDETQGVVKHGLMQVLRKNRNKMLARLQHVPNFKALVFFNQTVDLNKTYSYFVHNHYTGVAKLTSDQNQNKREKAMNDFRLGRVKLLFTTDVAARGLDIPKLPAVVNYDLPDQENEYIHRVGRTGRMGENGLVINFGDDHDLRDLKNLLKNYQYDLKPIYFLKNKLVDEIPESVIKAEKMKKLAEKNQPKQEVNVPKHSNKKANSIKASPKKSNSATLKNKRKKKNKHTKNKGMRKKWRNLDNKNSK
ncbi:DEAD/DEAH box helicase [Apilactobacillus micheneri]|uniref:DEAD/DEAH box helicase n=1 Tax=Apilactobacillus micheneri TaxID=1899430 RepID=A0ABY2Z241_9LACO|nr:DEAD/DEAH box helicase [Apilactobacillus micheneri]TPR24761.1 DEAD/DEAH box helicase [Apilactobacillus micheneri]TPR26072.1 DEAD/DEAH box helicase [Apilactobacillus micheneri]TPR28262.1 DEAD/DEAH box helicase [Apilactobacillus micheneri]TPR29753.1 DEAD/DEAH box helicase [Apilactobacillus micheneri]TPR30539.1 DEAD/DEAH box helicase [Apilactobacillus micheneri]